MNSRCRSYSVLQLCLLCIVQSYPNRCPVAQEWKFMSLFCSTKSPFHCLFHEHHGIYTTECRPWDWVQPGHYPILRGQFIDYAKCSSDRYQPVAFKSYNSHQCLFIKAGCSEEGQIESLQPVSTKTDRSCICDQSKGFHNVIKMGNELGCIPSLEDCTCYIKNHRPEYQLKSRYNFEKTSYKLDNKNCTRNSSFVKTNSTRVKFLGQNTNVITNKRPRQHVLMSCISMVLLFIVTLLVLLLRFQVMEDPTITGTKNKQLCKASIALDRKDINLGDSLLSKASENAENREVFAMQIQKEKRGNVLEKIDSTKRSAVLQGQTTDDTKITMLTTEIKMNKGRGKSIANQTIKKGQPIQFTRSGSTDAYDNINKRDSAVKSKENKTQNDKTQETKIRTPVSYSERPSQRKSSVSRGTGKPVDIKRTDSRGKKHPPKQPWR